MHFFMPHLKNHKPQQQQPSGPYNESNNQPAPPEIEQKVIKKIVVRKRPEIQLPVYNDNLHETDSQHFFSESRTSKSGEKFTPPPRDKTKGPFVSFMASQKEPSHPNTPYINGPKNNSKVEIESSQSNGGGRNLGRSMSRPIEPVSFESPQSKNVINNNQLIRQNSMKTEFQSDGQKKQLKKYPTEISLEPQDRHSGNGDSGDEYMPKFNMAKNKQIEISILETSKNSDLLNNSGFPNEIQTSKSSKYMMRPEFFRANTGNSNSNHQQMNFVQEIQDHDSQEEMSEENDQNIHSNKLTLDHRLNDALRGSRTVSGQSTQRSNVEEHISFAFEANSPPGYKSYIEKQNRELQEQKERMNFYAQEANKLLCNVQTYDPNQNQFEAQIDKHFVPLKYMIEELIELFSIGEVIKYQLRYRSYEILTKIFAEASDYYNEKIQLEEPIKAYTFSLALKAVLNEYEKSQIDTVVTKIFQSSHVISYEDFLLQFSSVLNSKLVAVLEPNSMKKEIDKTLDKIKNLFVIWIETEYYNKKVKDILRTSKVVYESILMECSTLEQPQKLDIELLEKFFLEGERKNPLKKIKLDLYFRSLIGNDLLKAKWIEWINKDEMILYNRYENKRLYERREFGRVNNNEFGVPLKTEKTIASTKKRLKINLQENHLSKKPGQSRRYI